MDDKLKQNELLDEQIEDIIGGKEYKIDEILFGISKSPICAKCPQKQTCIQLAKGMKFLSPVLAVDCEKFKAR